jgi:hypothetical protein
MDKSTGGKGTPTTTALDPDWNQEREIARMIQLAVAQIEMALQEGDESLDTLSHFFSSMAGSVNNISKNVVGLEEDADLKSLKETMLADCELVKSRMNTVIIAFQFYDRLSQRLGHVSGGLDSLARLMGTSKHFYSPKAFKDLRERMGFECSLEEEQVLFQALRDGCSVQEALRRCREAKRARGANYDIELF